MKSTVFLIVFICLIQQLYANQFQEALFSNYFEQQYQQQQPSATAQEMKCSNVKFGNEGAECVPGSEPENTKRCKFFLACHNGVCRDGTFGTQCTQDDQCFGNIGMDEGIRCINEKCIKAKYNGQPCKSDDECFGKTCVDGTCFGARENEECDHMKPVQCAHGLYCSKKNKCVQQRKEGDPCNDIVMKERERDYKEGDNFFVICPGGTKCTGPAHQKSCQSYRLRGPGEHCSNYSECQLGLVCDRAKRVCAEPDRERVRSIFARPCPTHDSHVNCTYNERCVCTSENSQEGKCETVINSFRDCNMGATATEFLKCQKKHNCPYERSLFRSMLYDSFAQDTCTGEHCGHIPRDFLCCAFGGHHYNENSMVADVPHLGCQTGLIAGVIVGIGLFLIFGLVAAGIVTGISIYLIKRKGGSSSTFTSSDGDSYHDKLGDEEEGIAI